MSAYSQKRTLATLLAEFDQEARCLLVRRLCWHARTSPATAGLSFVSVAALQSLTVLYWSTMKRILLAAGR